MAKLNGLAAYNWNGHDEHTAPLQKFQSITNDHSVISDGAFNQAPTVQAAQTYPAVIGPQLPAGILSHLGPAACVRCRYRPLARSSGIHRCRGMTMREAGLEAPELWCCRSQQRSHYSLHVIDARVCVPHMW